MLSYHVLFPVIAPGESFWAVRALESLSLLGWVRRIG